MEKSNNILVIFLITTLFSFSQKKELKLLDPDKYPIEFIDGHFKGGDCKIDSVKSRSFEIRETQALLDSSFTESATYYLIYFSLGTLKSEFSMCIYNNIYYASEYDYFLLKNSNITSNYALEHSKENIITSIKKDALSLGKITFSDKTLTRAFSIDNAGSYHDKLLKMKELNFTINLVLFEGYGSEMIRTSKFYRYKKLEDLQKQKADNYRTFISFRSYEIGGPDKISYYRQILLSPITLKVVSDALISEVKW